MRLRYSLPALLAASVLVMGPLGCTNSKWCADCETSAHILGLNYQSNVTYTQGTPIPTNPPNPAGGTPVHYEVTGGALPAGLSVDPVTGEITGTPTTPGVYTVTLKGNNKSNSATQTIAITVLPNVPLSLGYNTPMVFSANSQIPLQPGTLGHATPGIQTTFAVSAGSLPAGLALDPATGDITGMPTVAGLNAFSVTATNGTRAATTALDYTIVPAGSLTIAYATPLTFVSGTAIATQTPTLSPLTPGIPATLSVTGGSLPPGLAFNAADGTITGTPTTPGVYSFAVTVVNGTRTAVAIPTYTVTPANPLTVGYATPLEFTQGTVIGAQNPTVGNATPGLSTTFLRTGGTLPAGLSLNGATGAITGMPTAPGVYPFTVAATNGARNATATPTYTVVSSSPMTLGYATPQFFPVGSPITSQLPSPGNLTPGVSTTYSLSGGSLPAGLALNPADGSISGTPTATGVSAFTIMATNGSRSASASATYVVESTATLGLSYVTPRFFPKNSAVATQNPTVSNGTPGVTSTFVVTSGSLPAGLTLNTDGTITGTPGTAGVSTFTVMATNGTRTATATATYTVEETAALGLSYPTPKFFPQNAAIGTQAATLTNGTSGVSSTYAVTSGSLPAGLSLNAATGDITGTPTTAGVSTFTITATNGTRTATATPTYTVELTSALGLSYTTPKFFPQGSVIPTQSGMVSNATPGVSTAYAVTAGSLPAGLSLNAATGDITGTPTTAGVSTFTITVTNGTRTATATPTYTVELTSALGLNYSTPQTFPPNVAIAPQGATVTNGTPGVATTYAVTSGALPTGLSLNTTTGDITGTPTTAGLSTFTVTATNGTRTATKVVSYTIQTPAPTGLNYATPVTYTAGFAISNNNPNPTGGAPTSYVVSTGSLPAGLTLDPATGVISGTPTASGSFTVTITASNGGGSVQQVLSITVLAPISAALSANPGTVSVGQSSSLTPIFSGGTGVIDQSIGTVGTGGGIPTGVYSSAGTTTYTLTVTNANGDTRTASTTVTVVAAPPNSVTFNVPTTGTTYTYPTSGNPLSGLVVDVPNQGNAVCVSTDLTVSRGVGLPQPGAIGGGAVAVSDPWTFSSTVGYPFRKPMTVTLPYDGTGLGASDVPVPFYWDPAYGKWVAVGLKSFSAGSQTVTFTTLLPGQYTVMAIPGLSAALSNQSLGFTPTTDSWYQPNQGVFDDPGGSSFGMSSFASWYFGMRKATNGGAGLYSLFREGDVNSTADDVSARALISRLANGTLETWAQIWPQSTYALTGVQTGLAVITGLRVTGQPQVFVMGEARPAVDNAVTTLITGYNSGKFDVLDPNYPGMPLTITWNSGTGAFTSYDRAAGYVPTFTQYAFEGQTSIHRLADYERVFNGATGAWSNPPFATLTVSDVSGTGPVSSGALATVPSASNVTITGTVGNGSDTATYIYWSQNGGARTPVALSGNTFSFTIPALVDPYGTRIALETTANPCDPTFAFTGYAEFNVKEAGRTAWFPNICFETGATTPWSLQQGSNSGIGYPATQTFNTTTGALNSYSVTWSGGSIDSALVNVANDANVSSISQVFDGTTAFRVNNPATGSHISRIYQNITIPTDVATPKLAFYWAAVMQNAGHLPADQPYVDILIQDVTNSYETVYFKHFYANDPSYPGWIAGAGAGSSQWFGINWQKVGLSNLSARKGHVLKITVTAADCTAGGHGGYAYLDGVNCN
ncbi:MAG TPA: putative Ig domain-containing protein [Holophagaceae bacterium]|nr:putative Ig domain-containing protein [Holophagaceae bacterium]